MIGGCGVVRCWSVYSGTVLLFWDQTIITLVSVAINLCLMFPACCEAWCSLNSYYTVLAPLSFPKTILDRWWPYGAYTTCWTPRFRRPSRRVASVPDFTSETHENRLLLSSSRETALRGSANRLVAFIRFTRPSCFRPWVDRLMATGWPGGRAVVLGLTYYAFACWTIDDRCMREQSPTAPLAC